MRIRIGLALFVVTLLIAGTAWASGMKIEPGQWTFETTTQHPMSPQPMTKTTTECIESAEMNPSDMPDQPENCSISDVEVDSGSMAWKMTCNQDGGTMTGDFKMSSTGAAVNGTSVMVMAFQGQKIEIKTEWKGRRTGACTK